MTKAAPSASASGSIDVPIKPAQSPAVTPPPEVVATAAKPAKPLPSIALPYVEIERWAIANNLGSPTHGFDLEKVNERRASQGQRPFTIHRRPGKGGSP